MGRCCLMNDHHAASSRIEGIIPDYSISLWTPAHDSAAVAEKPAAGAFRLIDAQSSWLFNYSDRVSDGNVVSGDGRSDREMTPTIR